MNFSTARRISPRLLLPFLDRVQHSTEGPRLARGMAWSLVGAVSSRGLALLASVIAARILGKSGFGELGIVQTTTNMYGTFGQLGGLTAIKHVAEFRKSDPERAGRMIAMSIIVAAASGSVMGMLMVATSPWAARLLAAPHLQVVIATSALALLLILINEAQEGVLSGFEAFKRRSTVQFAMAITSFPIVVLGVYFFGLIGAVWGLIASQGLQAATEFPGHPKRDLSGRYSHSVARGGKGSRDSGDLQLADALFRSRLCASDVDREHDIGQQPRWICRNGDLQRR